MFNGVFDQINVNFLPVGHTHEDIDAVFSKLATKLRKAVVKTITKLMEILKSAVTKFGQTPEVRVVKEVPNVREWMLPVKPTLKQITKFRSFRIFRRPGSHSVYIKAKQTMAGDESTFSPPEGDLLLERVPDGDPCRVPLRPTQAARFGKAVEKYHQRSAFNDDDVKEWVEWLGEQAEREQNECKCCFELTSKLRHNGVRARDSEDVQQSKRSVYSKAERDLVAHLSSVGSDDQHKC